MFVATKSHCQEIKVVQLTHFYYKVGTSRTGFNHLHVPSRIILSKISTVYGFLPCKGERRENKIYPIIVMFHYHNLVLTWFIAIFRFMNNFLTLELI